MSRAQVSVLGFAVAVLALAGLVFRREILGTEPITIGLQAAAVLLMIWARITFGMRSFHAAANPTEGALVTHGPFAFVRNPIYAAVILFSWSGIAAHLNVVSALLGLVIAAGMLVRIFAEERELATHFGEPYAAYKGRVKRLVPFVF